MKRIAGLLLVLGTMLVMSVLNVTAVGAEEKGDVKKLIESLEVGEAVYYENLTIIPIYTTKIKDNTSYATLEEALKNKWLEITELEGGRVPQVKLTNHSDKYIYIMGGEILTGCRQDRLVGRDVLIRPKSKEVIVPVYCVEQGRWTYQSDKFYSKENLGTWDLRAEGQQYSPGAQSSIWSKVSRLNEQVGVRSGTNAYQAAYDKEENRRKISSIEQHMQRVPRLYEDTVGIIVAVADRIVSVDIFVNPQTFKKLWPKLIKSAALSAISSDSTGSVTQNEAADFLRTLHDKDYTQRPAVDLGLEFSVVDNEVNLNALVYRSSVIHLAAFPQEESYYESKRNPDDERRIPVIRR
jgi:hypothetical protein